MVTAPSTAPEGQPFAAFEVASDLGNERMPPSGSWTQLRPARATPVVERLDRVAEATMNAIEHGNGCRTEVPVRLQVSTSPTALTIRVDQGGDVALPEAETPDLEAKLEGLQTPRGGASS